MAPRSIALFGATGNVGSAILQELLRPSAGAAVTALVRSPSKLPADVRADSRLTVVEGDMDDVEKVRRVVAAGKDGVVAALNDQDIDRRKRHFGHLVDALKASGNRRLLFWGGAGALKLPKDPNTRLWQTPKYPKHLVKHNQEHCMILELAEKTDLDWTMLCPPMVYGVPATNKLKTAKGVPTGGTGVSAADMAAFVVGTLLDADKGKEWYREQVGLSSEGLSMNDPPKAKV
ncbi:NADH(P)-binding-domain-containing protein [Hyaloraphidium curvatum]|nr:NADH(P)-binding-domain-containing protein [Hyaloraphidium curvatum]